MVRVKASHRYVAWLAMLAMTLIVVMPSMMRMMPAHAMPGMDMGMCMDASCMHHATADIKHPTSPQAPSDPMEWCAYCVLLHHSPLLGTGAIAHVVPAAPAVQAPVFAVALGSPYLVRLSADPRGPPARVS